MVTTIAKFWIIPGNEDAAVGALMDLARKVEAEPGTLLYLVHVPDLAERKCGEVTFQSSPTPLPGLVTFVESYVDWEAFCAHVNGPNFQDFIRDYGHLFEQSATGGFPRVESTVLDRIGGFCRPESEIRASPGT